ncbi:DUF4293 domain-containing protein [Gilvibacter sediminis]|uniref:DUF4293 domain-containing protein n=1 Tax=Gilvibacter sediminis TaxID=379071 RepID=UPI0023509D02|nr:DUF4293 domain-containing protein [Gilvibacter sediminis]MDC7999399.1 DUF4293 domain-containing protein [Gilvibacter sediminis]
MLQRIQTVYMLLASLALIGLYVWFPVVADNAGQVLVSKDELLVAIPMALAILVIAISIFQFKKRQLQFVLNRLAILLNFFLLGVFVYRALSVSGEAIASEKGIGLLVPVVSIVFLALANKAIRRDEELVKSADRLR